MIEFILIYPRQWVYSSYQIWQKQKQSILAAYTCLKFPISVSSTFACPHESSECCHILIISGRKKLTYTLFYFFSFKFGSLVIIFWVFSPQALSLLCRDFQVRRLYHLPSSVGALAGRSGLFCFYNLLVQTWYWLLFLSKSPWIPGNWYTVRWDVWHCKWFSSLRVN